MEYGRECWYIAAQSAAWLCELKSSEANTSALTFFRDPSPTHAFPRIPSFNLEHQQHFLLEKYSPTMATLVVLANTSSSSCAAAVGMLCRVTLREYFRSGKPMPSLCERSGGTFR